MIAYTKICTHAIVKPITNHAEIGILPFKSERCQTVKLLLNDCLYQKVFVCLNDLQGKLKVQRSYIFMSDLLQALSDVKSGIIFFS